MRSSAIAKPRSAESSREESQARYRLLAESLPQYVWTTDAEGKIDYCNGHFLQFCGLTLADVQAGRVWEFIHPDDLAALTQRTDRSRATGEAFEYEYRARRASDGEYRWHLAHAEQFTDSDGGKRWLGVAST